MRITLYILLDSEQLALSFSAAVERQYAEALARGSGLMLSGWRN